MTTFTPPGATSERFHVVTGATDATSSRRGDRPRIPLTIPSSQAYYWSHEWQVGEAESLADYETGNYIESDDPAEIIRWLDEPDDE
jgi:hypothetical protein